MPTGEVPIFIRRAQKCRNCSFWTGNRNDPSNSEALCASKLFKYRATSSADSDPCHQWDDCGAPPADNDRLNLNHPCFHKRGALVAIDHSDWDEYWIFALVKAKADLNMLYLERQYLAEKKAAGRGNKAPYGNEGDSFVEWLLDNGHVSKVEYTTYGV